LDTPYSIWKQALRWFFGIGLFSVLCLGAEAAVYIIDEQSNPSGLIIKSAPANSGTLYSSSTAAATINSYQFAYWTLNGVRQADATGRAANPVKFVPTSDSTLEAVYKLATLDSDADGLLDVFELEFFGTLLETKASDGDADGFNIALEQLLGFHPGMVDWLSEGGLARRASATFPVLLNPAFYQVIATSDPPGFVEPAVQFANGSAQNITLPTAPASVNGYNFSGWYVASVRVEAPTALQPVTVSVSGETTFSAKYVLSTTDSDLDGLLDWFEWFAFSDLASDSLSDPDVDLISTFFEQLLGFAPYLKDAIVEGGLSRRSSSVVDVNLSGQFSLSIQSDPPGMQPSSLVYGVPNSKVDTPDLLNANVNGYRFTGWYVDGQRLTDSTGASAGKGSVLLSGNKVATALFVLDTLESDSDGIADWIEMFYTGGLSTDRFTDAEGDSLNFALEALVGFHPMLVDKVTEGGISRRGWGPSATDYVILNWRPVIEVHPVPVNVEAGAAFSLSVSVTSFAPETYQWQKDGVEIPGATAASYAVGAVSGAHSGAYRVVVTNAYGTATSNSAAVSVGGMVVVAVQPVALLSVNTGAPASFAVGATGTGPFSYQWRKNGVALAGATGVTFSLAAVQAGDVAKYDVVVSNVHGSATSAEGSLVLNTPVTISAPPAGAAVGQGTAVNFTVSAAGTAPLGYQWRKGGVAIPGAQSAQYTVASAQSYDEGSYDVVVTNPAGSVTSAGALLSVNSPPVIATHPNPLTVSAGSIATFAVTATGTAPLFYQWRKAGVAVAGGTQATYSIVPAQPSDAGNYDVVVTNASGAATSFAVPLLVNVAPTLLSQPASVAVLSGTLVSLGVSAAGTAPLSYQWRKGGTPVAGAIYPTFSLGSVRVTDAGVYDVVVANAAGSVTSGTAVLSVLVPPTVSVPPAGLLVQTGSSATFSVVANGTAPLLYQWRKNGTALAGGTAASFSLAAALEADSGVYDVQVSNAAGGVTSATAVLSVVTPPFLTTQPVSLTLASGGSASFSVVAGGTAPGYQWRRNGQVLQGGTSATYTMGAVTVADAGTYEVVVSNWAGSVGSNPVTLTVGNAPAIVTQPLSSGANVGGSYQFSVLASGTAPLGYQWRKAGVALAGGTGASLSLAVVQEGDAGLYDVVVSNAFGAVTSAGAKLIVGNPPHIHSQPLSVSVNAGGAATLSVGATSLLPLLYQWRKNGVSIAGANAATYRISATQAEHTGNYDVVVRNASVGVTSEVATVSLNVGVKIATQPASVAVNPGAGAVLSVAATGTGPLRYQWSKGGVAIGGATAASYAIAAAQPSHAGSYSVVVSNAVGSVSSAAATVTLNVPVSISVQPVGGGVNPGGSRTLAVVASGTGPLTYQWRCNGLLLPKATGATYLLTNAQAANVGSFDVVVTNVVGSVVSKAATVTLNVAVTISRQPVGLSVNPGKPFVFTVVAAGTGPLKYQWRRNGVAVAGAVAASYAVAAATAAQAGSYDVVVGNEVGNLTSSAAVLGVNTAVAISKQPVSLVVNPGAAAVLSVQATGTAPLTYQWRKGGVSVVGATQASLNLAAVVAADAATYDVVVGNPVGSLTSAPANLTVNLPVTILTQPQGAVLNSGASKTLTVSASGTAPLAYQWRKDGVVIAGATGAAYAVSSMQSAKIGVYDVLVSNPVGVVASAGATLTLNGAPSILKEPAGVRVTAGSAAVFSVTASGDAPLSYQWRKNGAAIGGALNASLVLGGAQIADAGSYDVVVSNPKGQLTSRSASLAVGTPVEPVQITQQPVSLSILAGGSAAFRVVAGGTAPSYQWRRNGLPIPSATGAVLLLPVASLGDSGEYGVVVSNAAGSVTSTSATLVVSAPVPVAFAARLEGVAVNPGGSTTVGVRVTGTGPFQYQWRKNGVPISGASAADYTLIQAKDADAGEYDVVVTSPAGIYTSNAARVQINVGVSVSSHPSSKAVLAGGSVAFSVSAAGTGPLSYQWSRNGVPLVGATGAVYALGVVQPADLGAYRVEVSNMVGSVSSNAAMLSLNEPVTILKQPSPVAVNVGKEVLFSVTVSGTPPFAYQWYRNGLPLPGATTPSYRVAAAQLADAGSYSVGVSNVVGSVASKHVPLLLNTPVQISAAPVSQKVVVGELVTLSVGASGEEPLFYQWRKNGIPIAGGTSSALRIQPVGFADAGSYDVEVANVAGRVLSARSTLEVSSPVLIAKQPTPLALDAYASGKLAVEIGGTGPFTYQWRNNGVAIPGATSAGHTIASAQPSQAGFYDVVISGASGVFVSNAAEVTVSLPPDGCPVVLKHPANVTTSYGGSATVSVTLGGTTPFRYQWKRNGMALGTVGTSAGGKVEVVSFTVAATKDVDEGLYTLELLSMSGAVLGQSRPGAIQLDIGLGMTQLLLKGWSTDLSKIGYNTKVSLPDAVSPNDTLLVSIRTARPAAYSWSFTTTTGKASVLSSQVGPKLSFAGGGVPRAPGAYTLKISAGAATRSVVFVVRSFSSLPGTLPPPDSLPAFVSQPMSLSVPPGAVADFGVSLSGRIASYVWYKRLRGAALPVLVPAARPSPWFTLDAATLTDAGFYSVEAVDFWGRTVRSAEAELQVIPAGE
jgi:hypothetical protein